MVSQSFGRTMVVEFVRIHERGYAVRARRANGDVVEMNPAPGYDDWMPHDLLHFIVERELGIRNGIFGQVAQGGSANTFFQRPTAEDARARRKQARRGRALMRDGRRDALFSEHATCIAMHHWLARAADAAMHARAVAMAPDAVHMRSVVSTADIEKLNAQALDELATMLDRVSHQWRGLSVGESILLKWCSFER